MFTRTELMRCTHCKNDVMPTKPVIVPWKAAAWTLAAGLPGLVYVAAHLMHPRTNCPVCRRNLT